ncbi:hypothetical protein LCGC14_1488730, partial [marine sediment metagenome]
SVVVLGEEVDFDAAGIGVQHRKGGGQTCADRAVADVAEGVKRS